MEVFPLIFFFFSLRFFFSPFSRHSVIIFFFFAVSLELGFCIVESELESFLFFSFLLSSFFWDVHHIGFFFLIGFLFLLASSLSSSSKFDTFFLLPFFLQVAFQVQTFHSHHLRDSTFFNNFIFFKIFLVFHFLNYQSLFSNFFLQFFRHFTHILVRIFVIRLISGLFFLFLFVDSSSD